MVESGSAAAGAAIWKFGLLKLLGFGAALIGASMMAVFRPPKSRKELFMQGAVALGASFLFGGTAVNVAAQYTNWINLSTATLEDVVQFHTAVYGLIGAFSWGVFGGFSVMRDKFGSDPIETIKEVKDVI